MKTKALLRKLSTFFPKKLAEAYDYPGLQVGKLKEDTNTVLLCLDFDEDVLNYILNNKLESQIDLIITHHPFIFGNKKDILANDNNKNYLYHKMEELNIPIYSFHTNFDSGKNGMNDALVEKLGLINTHRLISEPMACGGELPHEMDIKEFAKYALEKLNVDYGLLLNYGNKTIKSAAIIGGGGWRGFKAAQLESYDIFISGDIPHHGRRDVVANKYNYLDLPHEVENIFMEQMKKILLSFDNSINVSCLYQEQFPEVICK